jgi:hypothetical protein
LRPGAELDELVNIEAAWLGESALSVTVGERFAITFEKEIGYAQR